jgi:hypothetical protein
MEEIPKQLAKQYQQIVFCLIQKWLTSEKKKLVTSSGGEIQSDIIIIATEANMNWFRNINTVKTTISLF